jgi:hypothetical protein
MSRRFPCFTTEPFIGTTGKCHQQRLSSDKKTTTSLTQQQQQQQQHTHPQQPPLPALVTASEDPQQSPQQVTLAMRPVGCAELEDLTHLAGPLTEDAVLKCLQARFCASQFFVSRPSHCSCICILFLFLSILSLFSYRTLWFCG